MVAINYLTMMSVIVLNVKLTQLFLLFKALINITKDDVRSLFIITRLSVTRRRDFILHN